VGFIKSLSCKDIKSEVQYRIMNNNIYTDDVLFEVMTPLGFRVRVSLSHWELIITVKHPVMAGRELDVRKTL